MQFSRIVSFLFVFALGLLAYASPTDKRQSETAFTNPLNSAATSIHSMRESVTFASLETTLNQVITTLNTAHGAVQGLPPVLRKRALVTDVAFILEGLVEDVAFIVDFDVIPAVEILISDVDFALNELVITLDGLIFGLAGVLGGLLAGVAGLLGGLGLLLGTLGL